MVLKLELTVVVSLSLHRQHDREYGKMEERQQRYKKREETTKQLT